MKFLRFSSVMIGCVPLMGCTPNTMSPTIIARTPGNIVLVAGAQSHFQEALTSAEEECQRMDKRHAVLRSNILIGSPVTGTVRMVFECVRS